MATMVNGTMVQAFKFLNYYQLAKNSLVSTRYWNLIRTHRHRLALLDVDHISMINFVANKGPAVIKMFNKKLSPENYNEWIIRNGYSKLIPLDGQITEKESTENDRDIYKFEAKVFQNPNNRHGIAMTVFCANVELKDENWPVFQHFIRLLMDPFIYIRTLKLNPKKDALTLLTGAMNPDRNRLQCKLLIFRFNDDAHKFIVWIKDHVCCNEFYIHGTSDSNYDDELQDLFLTGAHCTSAIYVIDYDLSKVIVDLAQKFMGLKNRNEYQLVESIYGDDEKREVVEALKHNCAEFIAEEEKYDEDRDSGQFIEFINNDIEKKMTLNVGNPSVGLLRPWFFSIEITNL